MDIDGFIFPGPGQEGSGAFFSGGGFTATNIAAVRGKSFGAMSAIPFVTTTYFPLPPGYELINDEDERLPLTRSAIPYFTQVEGFIAILGGIRLGVNPGELLDFIAGIIGLDLFADDLSRITARQMSETRNDHPVSGVQ
jgi:hypothetical protein